MMKWNELTKNEEKDEIIEMKFFRWKQKYFFRILQLNNRLNEYDFVELNFRLRRGIFHALRKILCVVIIKSKITSVLRKLKLKVVNFLVHYWHFKRRREMKFNCYFYYYFFLMIFFSFIKTKKYKQSVDTIQKPF